MARHNEENSGDYTAKEAYRRFFVGQLYATGRVAKMRPDAVCRDPATRVAAKWWKQRSPLASTSVSSQRTSENAEEKELRSLFDSRSFSYEDWWAARYEFEVKPLSAFARTIGRVYAHRLLRDKTHDVRAAKHCGFPPASEKEAHARRKTPVAKQMWTCIYTVVGVFARQSPTICASSGLLWAGATCREAQGDELVRRCFATNACKNTAKGGLWVYECKAKYETGRFADYISCEKVCASIAKSGYCRWVDHQCDNTARFRVVAAKDICDLLADVIDLVFHSSRLCVSGPGVSALGNRLLGGRNVVAVDAPLEAILTVADVACEMVKETGERVHAGCAKLEKICKAEAAASNQCSRVRKERADKHTRPSKRHRPAGTPVGQSRSAKTSAR